MQRVVVPRWIQLIILPLALLGLWDLARVSGAVLLIVVAASVIAMILNPLSKQFEHVLPRALAILASYLLVLVVIGAIVVLLANPIANQVNHFSNNIPTYINQANHTLDKIQTWFNEHGVRVHIKKQGQSALTSLEHTLTTSTGSIVSFSRDVLGKAISFGIDLVLTFVLSVYLLVYARQIGQLVRRIVPPGDGTPGDDFPLLIQRAVSGYVRGQLLFSLVMGASATLALFLFGVVGLFPDGRTLAFFFGAFYGLMELIPYVGPIVGPIPAVLVALFTNPISAIWVIGLFVVLQQLEGHLVAPQVFRLSLRINPILVILSLLIGFHLYGVVGALLALPVASVIRQTVEYLRRHLVLEEWSTTLPKSLLGSALLSEQPGDAQQHAPPPDTPEQTLPPSDDTEQTLPSPDDHEGTEPLPAAGREPSALAGDPEESPDEEGREQQQDDRDPGTDEPGERQHQRDHARDAGR